MLYGMSGGQRWMNWWGYGRVLAALVYVKDDTIIRQKNHNQINQTKYIYKPHLNAT